MKVEQPKYHRFYIDWWRIKRSTVYGILTVFGFLILFAVSIWWLVKSGYFYAESKEDFALPADAARIASFEGDVRIIRASTRNSEKVTSKTFILPGDTIQTGVDGKAEILMIDGSKLWIRPNSTVVIRDNSSILGSTNVRVSLGTGQINVRTEDQAETSQNIVEVKESENRLFAQTEASFNINQKLGTGEIRISRGSVETSIGGEKIIIKDNEFASVSAGKLAAKEKLLQPPKLIAPAFLEQIPAKDDGRADVNFRWQKIEIPSATYDVQISTSPFFVSDALIRETENLTTTNLVFANMNTGNYYWRVRATASSSGQTTEWSEPWRFTVVKHEKSKPLTATDWRIENLGGGIYRVSARTEPGATIRILDRETFAMNDGSFTLQIRAYSPEVTVKIINERGISSQLVLSLRKGKIIE